MAGIGWRLERLIDQGISGATAAYATGAAVMALPAGAMAATGTTVEFQQEKLPLSEALLSIRYRIRMPDGSMAGGPMYVLERGMKMRWLAVVFAALTAVAAFGIGNMVQANSISTLLDEQMGVSRWASGAVMTVLTAIVILGGIQSIARVCEALVPFMAGFYVIGCLILLIDSVYRSARTGAS